MQDNINRIYNSISSSSASLPDVQTAVDYITKMQFELPTTFAAFTTDVRGFISSPTTATRHILLFIGARVPWWLVIPAAVGFGLICYGLTAAAFRFFKYIAFGPVRSVIAWSLGRSAREKFAEKLRRERDNDIKTLADWAAAATAGASTITADVAERVKLIDQPIHVLREQMISLKLSPVLLLKACILNAVEAQKATNCIAGVVPPRKVIAAAEEAERQFKEAAASNNADAIANLPPLLGIPMSCKECIPVADCYSTAGCFYFAHANGKCTNSAALPELLTLSGANIWCTTTVPQTMLAFECASNLYGVTSNAQKIGHSPGGSSGGEASLIASRGAVAGIGTDIGGSLRIPCAFQGLSTVRPSLWRVPLFGSTSPNRGQEGVSSTAGPMCKNIDDVVTVFRSLVSEAASSLDGTCNSIPFRDDIYNNTNNKKLRFACWVDDGWMTASPAARRAVLETRDKLRAAGHEVVDVDPGDLLVRAMHLFYSFIAADGCETVSRKFDTAEPPMKAVLITFLTGRVLPMWVFNTVAPAILDLLGASSLLSNGLRKISQKSVAEYYEHLAIRNQLRTDFVRKFFIGGGNFDAILCPAFAFPAPKVGATADKSWAVSYTAAYNVLDMSCVTIPATVVDPKLDAWTGSEPHGKPTFDLMDKKTQAIYNAEEMKGLPVSVQLVTTRTSEEKVLGIAKQVEQVLKFNVPVPEFLRK